LKKANGNKLKVGRSDRPTLLYLIRGATISVLYNIFSRRRNILFNKIKTSLKISIEKNEIQSNVFSRKMEAKQCLKKCFKT